MVVGEKESPEGVCILQSSFFSIKHCTAYLTDRYLFTSMPSLSHSHSYADGIYISHWAFTSLNKTLFSRVVFTATAHRKHPRGTRPLLHCNSP